MNQQLIESLLSSGQSIKIEVSLQDLKEIIRTIQEDSIAQSEEIDKYYPTSKVCEILDINENTLTSWAKKKILIPSKIGQLNRYKKSDILALLQK